MSRGFWTLQLSEVQRRKSGFLCDDLSSNPSTKPIPSRKFQGILDRDSCSFSFSRELRHHQFQPLSPHLIPMYIYINIFIYIHIDRVCIYIYVYMYMISHPNRLKNGEIATMDSFNLPSFGLKLLGLLLVFVFFVLCWNCPSRDPNCFAKRLC